MGKPLVSLGLRGSTSILGSGSLSALLIRRRFTTYHAARPARRLPQQACWTAGRSLKLAALAPCAEAQSAWVGMLHMH